MAATIVLAGLVAAAAGPPAGAAPGDLDPAFGTGGIARIEGPSVGGPTAVTVQPERYHRRNLGLLRGWRVHP